MASVRGRCCSLESPRFNGMRGAIFWPFMTHFTPFFQFALSLVVPGALIILAAALLWTGRA